VEKSNPQCAADMIWPAIYKTILSNKIKKALHLHKGLFCIINRTLLKTFDSS